MAYGSKILIKPLKYLFLPFPPFGCSCLRQSTREFSSVSKYLKYYAILEIPPSSDQEVVRRAFVELVKKYHPDSDSHDANKDKFQQIETAYRKLQEKFAAERWSKNEGVGEYGLYYEEKADVKEFDIKHTAPQHRQYLNYEGYGVGTPRQREKQYQKKRAMTAVQNVYNHRVSKIPQGESEDALLVIKDKKESKKIKTRSEMERLVEDLIQESMARGDFNNLKGSGKPLSRQNNNPYVDFVTYKMNEVLIDNGFTPEWITLQKEITKEISDIRSYLTDRRTLLGREPLNDREVAQWNSVLKEMDSKVATLNKKINSFNLQVPILERQMVFFQLNKEAEKILHQGKTKRDVPPPPQVSESKKEEEFTFAGLLEILLFKK